MKKAFFALVAISLWGLMGFAQLNQTAESDRFIPISVTSSHFVTTSVSSGQNLDYNFTKPQTYTATQSSSTGILVGPKTVLLHKDAIVDQMDDIHLGRNEVTAKVVKIAGPIAVLVFFNEYGPAVKEFISTKDTVAITFPAVKYKKPSYSSQIIARFEKTYSATREEMITAMETRVPCEKGSAVKDLPLNQTRGASTMDWGKFKCTPPKEKTE